MRRFFLLLALGLRVAQADPLTVESLPMPVRNTLQVNLGKGTVQSVENYQWADANIYVIKVTLEGKPYRELHIAENGRLVRQDEFETGTNSDEEDEQSPTPTPRWSRWKDCPDQPECSGF